VTFTVASGIEARLIEAEAALQGGDVPAWLATLNHLREGIGLADTTDPGSAAARVNLLFRERAFWLYLTAHRQGDLRRLLRQYPGRSPDDVYPSGFYQGGSGTYGHEIVVPVPESERQLNPKYTGCFNRGA
jgi:starch-binding outer membrane protein, SusD/RagB family